MSCPGELKPRSGCSLRSDCIGHGVIDCQVCGHPVAEHTRFDRHPKGPWRTPRPPAAGRRTG
jgi:hypothetical protein